MKSSVFMVIAVLVLTSLLLGACNMPTATPAFVPPANVPNLVPQVPIANNIVHVLGSPMVAGPNVSRIIHVWADTSQAWRQESSGPTGISSVSISYAGNRIGSAALDPNLPSAYGSMQWTPPAAPGDYTVQADAGMPTIPSGLPGQDLSATFCVDNLGITIGELVAPGDHICSLLPSPETTAPFRITHTDASARMGCNTTTLEFDITVEDPSNQVYYAFADLANLSDQGFHTLATATPGPSLFSLVASWWNTADVMRQLAGTNTITWTAGAVAHSGQVILDGPHQLTISPPACPSFPALTTPLIPRIPSLIPYVLPAQPQNALQTNTPTATVVTCGPGTYYDAASNGCLKNATNTPIPTKRPPACKKHNDEASCGAAGCHWDSKTSTCGEP